MTEDHSKEILDRLAQLEERIARIEANKSEKSVFANPVTPPPFVKDVTPKSEIPAQASPQQFRIPRPEPAIPLSAKSTAQVNADAEYNLGAKFLPWLGAALVVLAIIFGVSIAYEKGWITPTIIFTGGVILCLGFIAVGQWLRDEREQFGQILTGIGSCGLYCTFAAGYLAQNLFDGKVLTLLYLALSLVNLAYCYWRSSTAFLTMGLIGGFLGVLMPLQELNVPLHLVLHALILIPCAVIISRRKWFGAACLLYPIAMLVLAPAQFMDQAHWLKVGSLYFTALVCVCAYGKAFRTSEWDTKSLHLMFSLAGTAWIAFEVRDGYMGSAHIVGFGALLYLLSLLKWDETVKNRLQLAAAGIPLILAPWGGTKIEAAFILIALSLGLAALSQFRFTKAASIFASIQAGLAVAAYLTAHAQGSMTLQVEFVLLPLLMLAIVVAAYSLNKTIPFKDDIVLAAALISIPILNRLVFLTFMNSPGEMTWQDSFIWGQLAGIYALSFVSWKLKTRSAASFTGMLAVLALAFFGWVIAQNEYMKFHFELPVICGVALALISTALTTEKNKLSEPSSVTGIVAVPLALLFVRFGAIVLAAFWPFPFAVHAAASVGIVIICLYTLRKNTHALWAANYALWFIAVYWLFSWEPPRERFAIAQLGLQFITLILSAYAFNRFLTVPATLRVCQAIAGFFIFTSLMVQIFTLHAIGAMPNVVATVAWAVYATALLVAGFAMRASELRYGGLILIGITAFKLLAVDLSTTPDGPRFLITLAVGLAMIGGGYLYIRLQNRLLGTGTTEASPTQGDRPTVQER